MSTSSHDVMSRPDAPAGPQANHEPPPLVVNHASDSLHDPASHDDSIWSTNVTPYLKERVHLVPCSSSSSSSVSTTSRRRTKTKSKSNSKGLGFSQLAEPYREDQAPSFRSAHLRPPAAPRTLSSPATLTERPLSMSEIMSWRREDLNEEYNPPEEDDKVLGQNVGLGQDEDSDEGTRPRDERSSHPENLAPGPLRVRGRCHSSPGSTDPFKTPFSSFTDVWR